MKKQGNISISSTFNYGFAEDRLREGNFITGFNNINNAYISLNGGSTISQFNPNEPISNLVKFKVSRFSLKTIT